MTENKRCADCVNYKVTRPMGTYYEPRECRSFSIKGGTLNASRWIATEEMEAGECQPRPDLPKIDAWPDGGTECALYEPKEAQ